MKNVVAALVACLSLCACVSDPREQPAPAPALQAVEQVVPQVAPEPAPVELPRFEVVVALPVDAAAMATAIAAWNEALGFEVLVLAPAETAPSLPDHVYVTASTQLKRGEGANTALAEWVYTMAVRPDLVASPRVLAHELGHVLGGWEHSDVKGSLMYWMSPDAKAPIVITAEDVAQVRTWLGL